MTTGNSAMPAMPKASTISENPPPEVAVIARAPAYEAPSTVLMAAISSSDCSMTSPASACFAARYSIIGVDGDIGYPA